MFLEEGEVLRVFEKVKTLRDQIAQYATEGLQPDIGVDTILDRISDIYSLNITMYEVDYAGDTIAGNVERYRDGRAIIMVRSKLPEEMSRLVQVKELCHLMIDEEDDWSNDPLGVIRDMKVEFDLAHQNGDGVLNPSRPQKSEHLAMIAACALLYPCEYHALDMKKVEDGEKTVSRVALEHNLPAWVIELVFTHRSIYGLYHCDD